METEIRSEIDRLDREYQELHQSGNTDAAWQKRREYLLAQARLWELRHPAKAASHDR